MLYFYSGTDKSKSRSAMHTAMEVLIKRGMVTMRITDASSVEDLSASLQGGGMFALERVVVLEAILENDAMRDIFMLILPTLKASADHFFLLEEKPDAATRKTLEKHATSSEKFESAKKSAPATTIFALANALRAGNKKALWVGYQRELQSGAAPEAIAGVLFWAVKDMLLKSRSEEEKRRAQSLIKELTELPHDARRHGEDLEYALERFVLGLSPVKA
jgi:hypothetical protein